MEFMAIAEKTFEDFREGLRRYKSNALKLPQLKGEADIVKELRDELVTDVPIMDNNGEFICTTVKILQKYFIAKTIDIEIL